MVQISVEYEGDLHCLSIHGPSQAAYQRMRQETISERVKRSVRPI